MTLFQNSSTQILVCVCGTFYGRLFPEPGSSLPAVLKKDVSIKCDNSTLQGQSGASDSQPVSMFSYLKNFPLTLQTRVLSCEE